MSPPQSSRRRGRRRSLGAVVLALLVLSSVPASAGPEAFGQLGSGDWRGSGEAGGTTLLELPEGQVRINAHFAADLRFTVETATETTGIITSGTWELSDGVSFWTITGGDQFAGEASMLHTASGHIFGTADRPVNGATAITSTGTVTLVGLGDQPVDATDTLDDLEMKVTRQLCNDAWGEWVFSWNTQLSGAQLTPTFDGNWHAVRFPPETAEEARAELEENIRGLLGLRQQVGELMRQPSQFGVPVVPYGEVWATIEQAVRYINLLNNLNRCEKAFFGEDAIADYVNALTNIVRLMVNVLLDNYALEGDQISGQDLVELVTMAASVGAIGSGAVDQEAADFTEQRLEQEASRAASSDDPVDQALGQVAMTQLGSGS